MKSYTNLFTNRDLLKEMRDGLGASNVNTTTVFWGAFHEASTMFLNARSGWAERGRADRP